MRLRPFTWLHRLLRPRDQLADHAHWLGLVYVPLSKEIADERIGETHGPYWIRFERSERHPLLRELWLTRESLPTPDEADTDED